MITLTVVSLMLHPYSFNLLVVSLILSRSRCLVSHLMNIPYSFKNVQNEHTNTIITFTISQLIKSFISYSILVGCLFYCVGFLRLLGYLLLGLVVRMCWPISQK